MGPPSAATASATPVAGAPKDGKDTKDAKDNRRPQICHSQKRRACQVDSNKIAVSRLRELVASSVVEETPRVEKPKAPPPVAFDRELLAKIAAEAKANAPVEEEPVVERESEKKKKKEKKEKKWCDLDDAPAQSPEAIAAAAAVLAKAKELAEAQEKARKAAAASAPVSLAFKPLRGGLSISLGKKKSTTPAEASKTAGNELSQAGPRGGPNASGPTYGIKKAVSAPDQSGPRGGAYATGPTYGLRKKAVDVAPTAETPSTTSRSSSEAKPTSLTQLVTDSSKTSAVNSMHLSRLGSGFSSPSRGASDSLAGEDTSVNRELKITRAASRSRDRSSDGKRKKRRRKSRSRERR